MKFYPRDWRGDQALRAVSIAARGLWMEYICIMHEAEPYGHLLLNGMPVEHAMLARMTGVSVTEVSDLIAELRQAGVMSVTSEGVIFSRRMVRDYERAQKGKEWVSKRWSKPADSANETKGPNRSPISDPITQKPEARDQKDNTCTKPPKRRLSYSAEFEEFWKLYPIDRLMSKIETFKAWSRLDEEDQERAGNAIPALKAECRRQGPKYRTPHATTYLNQRRFDGLLERPAIKIAADGWGETPLVVEPANEDIWTAQEPVSSRKMNGSGDHQKSGAG
jgi:hypothetical protein